MTDPAENKDSISDEFSKLGDNIKNTFTALWESEDRKKATRGLEQGLTEIGKAIDNVAQEVTKGEAAQKIRQDVGDLQERLKSGQVEGRVREDLLQTLKKVNEEFGKFSQRWTSQSGDEAQPQDSSGSVETKDNSTND